MKGCGYKFGCATKKCGCQKNGEVCGPGCRCTNCANTKEAKCMPQNRESLNMHSEDHYRMLDADVSDIMLDVFGQEEHVLDTDQESDAYISDYD